MTGSRIHEVPLRPENLLQAVVVPDPSFTAKKEPPKLYQPADAVQACPEQMIYSARLFPAGNCSVKTTVLFLVVSVGKQKTHQNCSVVNVIFSFHDRFLWAIGRLDM